MRIAVPAVLALFLLATAPPAQAAVHGVWWDATGVAVNAAGEAYVIKVHWSGGNFFSCPPQYTVTLTTAAGSVARTFRGFQNQITFPTQGFIQEGFVDNGGSLDAAVQFSFTGVQWATIGNMPHLLTQAITGTYQGLTFTAVTAQPWNFDCSP